MSRIRSMLRPGVLVWVSLAAFTLAFLGASALGMGPDEPAHYVKAAAAARGDLTGDRVTPADVRRYYPFARARDDSAAERERSRITAQSGVYNSRFFSLPASVAVDQLFPCFAQQRAVPASCGTVTAAAVKHPDRLFTYVGAYPPVPYAVTGIGTLLPAGRSGRWYAARLINAAVALALLAIAVALLLEGAQRMGWRLAGLSLAMVPTVLFVFAVVNASAWEIAGGLVVAAAVLRLSRPDPPSARTWTWIAIGATALAVSRPLGPFWLLPFAVLLVVLTGWRRIGELWRAGRAPKVAVAVVAVASATTFLWVRLNDASTPILKDRIDDAFRLAVSDLWLVVLQIPAIFGWNDTPIAIPWYWMYGLGLVALAGAALVYGRARERVALGLAVAMSIGAAIFIAAIPFEMYRQRYAMQARYVLPFAVVIPLLVGELFARGAERAPRSRPPGTPWYPTGGLLPAAVITFMTTVQLVGWWTNAVRNAKGFGGFAFWGAGAWTPPLGWAPWLVLVAVGVGSGLGAAYLVWRAPDPADGVDSAGVTPTAGAVASPAA